MHHLRYFFLVLLLMGLVTVDARADTPTPSSTKSGDTAEVEAARKHFAQGLKLYKEGDFDAALVQFERAYAVKPNFKVLYNIAQSHFELRQYVEARDALTRYLKDGSGSIEADRQAAVTNDLAELERRIAHVTVKVDVDGATVYVDGKKVGVTPLSAALDVSEGQRTVSVETSDRGTKQRVVRVGGGESQTISVDFALPAQPPTIAVQQRRLKPNLDRATGGPGTAFWVMGGLAVALGASAGATGYLALKAQSQRERDLGRFGVSAKELADDRSRAKTFALTTDILAGSAVVCAGVATVMLISGGSSEREVALGVGPASLDLRGSF